MCKVQREVTCPGLLTPAGVLHPPPLQQLTEKDFETGSPGDGGG